MIGSSFLLIKKAQSELLLLPLLVGNITKVMMFMLVYVYVKTDGKANAGLCTIMPSTSLRLSLKFVEFYFTVAALLDCLHGYV